MDSNTKEPYQNNANIIPNNELNKNETISKQTHQHNFTPQYYPFVHQHPQILNRSHMHQFQSPLLLNIPSAQQMQHPNATHRHFQYSPQYTVSHENAQFFAKNQMFAHQHIPRINNQLPQDHSQEAQVWLPQQPPTIKCDPQEQKENNLKKEIYTSTPNQSNTKLTPPKTKDTDKKKSGGFNPQLRSPCPRRPTGAPVTMQGWLHKQGSEGLMLWKKRWFVLSEYCLFYYKGSAEEKLLGSILLPSYKVSLCKPEDKVYRKYAFKCEHANMRTYVLAADSQELLLQWVHLLTLACNLQTNIGTEKIKQDSIPSIKPSISTETSETFTQNNLNKTPLHTHTPSNTTDLSNSTQQELNQYNQPLYANAPPKPRRLNDGCYSSPSSDMLDKYGYTQYMPPVHYPRNTSKSPLDIYRQYTPTSQTSQHECMTRVPNEHILREIHGVPQNVDRRTPDTYGRSQLTKFKSPSDYEDIYGDRAIYKRPLSPVAANDIKKTYPSVNLAYKGYSPVNMIGPPRQCMQYDPVQLRKSPVTITRPHSADFLEYKSNQGHSETFVKLQQPRPKSSLDINKYSGNNCDIIHFQPDPQYMTLDPHRIITNPNKREPNESDNYFYSQEHYAEKMRKSAQYLHKIPFKYQSVDNSHRKHKERCSATENHMNSYNSRVPNFNSTAMSNNMSVAPEPMRSRSVLSEGSLLCAQDIENESSSPDYPLRSEQYINNNRNIYHDQFTRSASARLAHSQEDSKMISMEGERKREESMKRLLEWKQRMLQSPLNRKAQAQGYRLYPARPESNYIYQNCYQSVNPENKPKNLNSRKSVNSLVQYNSYSSDDEASGSISLPRNAVELQRDTFPRVAKKIWQPNLQNTQALSTTNLERSYNYGSVTPGPYDVRQEDLKNSRNDLASNNSINVSAGELLGRTHEELVLLLIQLRRQSAQTFQAIESCYNEIDKLQACHNTDQSKRLENLQKLEKIKQNLIELEKQYEKGKPLVNLVDNMVKLGSLYRIPPNRNDMARYIRDRLEFNQHLQERRLLAEEKREWSRIETNQAQLQEKVQQLYQLDRLIQEESENLQNLQQDKEDIERALGGLRCRLMKGFNNPEEVEQARRQQVILENELSRVHLMLAQNSKKLEESVAGNARLEQELLVLKQKLQISRQQRSSPQFSNPGDSLPFSVGNSAVLESDLKRVQKKIGDLHKQREELSLQVRQLTDRSSNIQIQKASIPCEPLVTGKKKPSSVWRETDLDTMSIIDHGYSSDNNPCNSTTPLYINTDVKHGIPDSDYYERSLKSSDSTSDDTALSSNVLEKQEIKTVRIVKRESERRQRDREKSTATGKCDILLEEDDSSQNSSILFRPTSLQKPNNQILKQNANKKFSANTRPNSNKSSDLSPIFKSEAARQIITEVQDAPKVVRRTIPREKRRHYTAPNNNLIAENFGNLPADGTRLDTRRARDDLDIERALRQRIDAPDIVRSTLSNKELKYNEETIDNILSTPNKIIIPERYIPEQLPQLSPEEQERRMRKVESIKKMLSDTAIISSATSTLHIDDKNVDKKPSPTNKGVASTSITEEKKQREHLLQLNQILAKQVMEMSKVVAGNNDSEDNK